MFVTIINEWRNYFLKNGFQTTVGELNESEDRWRQLRALRDALPSMNDGDQRNRSPIPELGGRMFESMVAKGFADKEGQALRVLLHCDDVSVEDVYLNHDKLCLVMRSLF